MNWAEAVPNLLICLREGLEAGLVVTILLAAVRKAATAERPVSTAPIWLGLLGAISVAGSFAAVLTYSTSVLSSSAQQAVGGVLSILAVIMVTAMIFWMRRTARTLSKQLRGEVVRAAALGAGALALTAFLAVGREGLETTLFVWTAVKASGATVAPLIGAALGLIIAIALCWLLYRQSVRFNLGVFFNRTAVLLIVIAAGVLAYGLGDLQDAGWLPGTNWIAFDITAHADPNSWWVAFISGITELTPKMRVLQVVAWVAYLVVVIPLFVRAGRPAPAAAETASATTEAVDEEPKPDWWERFAGPRLALVATALVVIPVAAAGIAIALLPSSSSGSIQAVTITDSSCASDWKSGKSGTQTFAIQNKTSKAGEINLLDAGGSIVGEIETIGPATTADMTATLGNGSYIITCLMSGKPKATSPTVQVSGASGSTPPAVKPVTADDLTPANNAYQAYADQVLTRLAAAVTAIGNDVRANNIPAAQADWLNAQMEWERVGASYNSFGDAGTAVDGLPNGRPDGPADAGFTGLHRIEYGLWHDQGPDQLLPALDRLGGDIAAIQKNLSSDDLAGDPTNLPIRAHEILEDALRDHLFGIDDQGSGAAYPLTDADIDVTRAVLDELGPLLDARDPGLRTELSAHLDTLHTALLATQDNGRWRAPAQTPDAQRQAVRAALGAALEDLARVPRLLEVPIAH
ncbi:iron uptake transporter permease EfeU [Nocardia macrotermitis]|uniref:iron uptake transporter permease EfeU n=1 Tax=Nocardia macrotermitis TaxID=2585198 RepID=UPI0029E7DA78|nr:iron uptake transporter permease EfeU [Nocardia macrotermitis]